MGHPQGSNFIYFYLKKPTHFAPQILKH